MKGCKTVLAALAIALVTSGASARPPEPEGRSGPADAATGLNRLPARDAGSDGGAGHDSLAACSAALARPPTAGERPAPSRLRLMSWNTMKYSREGSRQLVENISDHADLVLLQEATRRDGPARGNDWHRYFADGYLAWSALQTGVELRSRFPADTLCTLSFMEPWLRSPKAVLAARLPFTEYALLLVNLHAINFTVGVGAYAMQLEAIGELLAAHTGPAIVAGDFNNWNGDRQGVLVRFARDQGLSMARFEPDWRSRHLGAPVDGVLQRGFSFLDATALPTSRSDHHPLIVLMQRAPRAPRGAAPAAVDARDAGP